jgi:MoaA/NifB/PqqE/SkfB family radical SAM enzyme
MKGFSLRTLLSTISYEPQLNLIAQMFNDEEKKNIPVSKHRFDIDNSHYILLDNEYAKVVIGYDYNYIFLKKSMFGCNAGFFQRWGNKIEDNPNFSPIGPEILDIEISVNGCQNACSFCYKNNKNIPATNMSLDTFKSIIDKFPRTLTQVAFGITGVQTNPDFIPMMEYCRSIGVVPNFTLSGIDLTDELADKLAKVSGALACSAYQTDKNVCYDTVKKFTDRGMSQVNIHLMVSQETLEFAKEVINDRVTDPRLSKLHAIVFLGVKPKGRAKGHFHTLTQEQYEDLIRYTMDKNFNFGFDSCSAPKFEASVKNINLDPQIIDKMIESSEPCESSLFSSYINTHGEYWHCSFAEEQEGQEFVDVIQAKDFIADVWYSEPVKRFRQKSIQSMHNGCRQCTVYPEINI